MTYVTDFSFRKAVHFMSLTFALGHELHAIRRHSSLLFELIFQAFHATGNDEVDLERVLIPLDVEGNSVCHDAIVYSNV